MLSKSKIIKKYNLEYASILESFLGDNIKKLLNATEIQLLDWAYENGNISIPHYTYCTSLQSIFLNIINEIDNFWKSCGFEYLAAVRELEGLSILAEENQSYLGVFFDTVLIQDYTLSIRRISYDKLSEKFLNIGHVLRGLVGLLPLLKSDSEFPIIALIPISFQSDQFFCPYIESSEHIDTKKVLHEVEETLGLISKLPQDYSLPYYGVRPDKDGNVTLDNLYDIDGFLNLFGFPDSIPHIDFKTTTPDFNKLLSLLNTRPCKIPHLGYDAILRNIYSQFVFMEVQDKICHYLKSERSIINSFSYRKKIEIESKCLVSAIKLDDEFAASLSLNLPSFRWISNINPEQISRYREAGGLEEFRNLFREERKRIKYATLDDLPTIAKSVSNNLELQIEEFNKKTVLEKKKLEKQMWFSGLSFTATVALTIITIYVPPSWIITIPAAAIALIGGTDTAKDLSNNLKKEKKFIKEIGGRPIGIMANLHNTKLS